MSNNSNNSNNSSNPTQASQSSSTNTHLLSPSSALELYRLSQLQQFANLSRIQPGPPQPHPQQQSNFLRPPGQLQLPPGVQDFSAALLSSYHHPSHPIYNFHRFDPRFANLCRAPDEPKPQHSYIGLIAMAILSNPDKKLVLSDIYQYILDNYPYFRSRGPGWRNSIRHNLSLNECFIKAGRSANGKGHYWAIHPANLDDFIKGDFRRRKAQRKFRKHMGLAVDDEDSPSPPNSPPPINWPDPHHHHHPLSHPHQLFPPHFGNPNSPIHPSGPPGALGNFHYGIPPMFQNSEFFKNSANAVAAAAAISTLCNNTKNRRQFDVASLLAPEVQSTDNKSNNVNSNPPSPKFDHLKRKCSGESSGIENLKNNSKKYKYAISVSSSSSEAEDGERDEPVPSILSHEHSPKTRSNSVSPIESIINQKSSPSPNNHHSNYLHQPSHHHHQLIFGPQYPHFSLHPHNLPLFQNSSSLASLMYLSSKYRELTATTNNNNNNSGGNNLNPNHSNSNNSPTDPIVNCMNLKRTT